MSDKPTPGELWQQAGGKPVEAVKVRRRDDQWVWVDAVRLTADADWDAIARWCGGVAVNLPIAEFHLVERAVTVQGMVAVGGDWIIRDRRGRCRVLTVGEFERAWEPVPDEQRAEVRGGWLERQRARLGADRPAKP